MRTLRTLAEQPVGLVIGFAIASILFLAAFTLALTTGRVLATHDATGNVHACINPLTGQARIMLPDLPPSCTPAEQLVEWPGSSTFGDLEARVQALEDQVPDCMASEGVDAVFEGCNLHVRNGMGSTDSINGDGNLIVGYNEDFMLTEDRSGSHNLVVGPNHTYSSHSGLVAGISNNITAAFASVSGGNSNTASGMASSVSGGNRNEASGMHSSVSSGLLNSASGEQSSVSGGRDNDASGNHSSVSGGEDNQASGVSSSVSGGFDRETDSMDSTHDWRGGNLIEDS